MVLSSAIRVGVPEKANELNFSVTSKQILDGQFAEIRG